MKRSDTSIDFRAGDADKRVRDAVKEHGYCRVRRVLSPRETRYLRGLVDRLLRDPPRDQGLTWWSPTSDARRVVQRISRANLYSVALGSFFLRMNGVRRLGSWTLGCTAAEVTIADGKEGSDGIVIVVKDPRNASEHASLRWHRDDTFTKDLPINPFVNCGVYLDDADLDRGSLVVLPASSRFPLELAETHSSIAGEVSISAMAGDVVIHRCDVWHRSGPYRLAKGRRRVVYGNLFHGVTCLD